MSVWVFSSSINVSKRFGLKMHLLYSAPVIILAAAAACYVARFQLAKLGQLPEAMNHLWGICGCLSSCCRFACMLESKFQE